MSPEQRRWAIEQAIASCRTEGFEPSSAFMADVDRVIRDEMSFEQMRERSRARAQAPTCNMDGSIERDRASGSTRPGHPAAPLPTVASLALLAEALTTPRLESLQEDGGSCGNEARQIVGLGRLRRLLRRYRDLERP